MPSIPVVELHNVKKVYQGKVPVVALKGIDLQINEGETVAIQGPSGSGKTTLLTIIGTLSKPTEGDVIIYGKNVTKMKDKEIAKIRNQYIGFVFQSYNLIERMTAIENIELPLIARGVPKSERRKVALDVLARLGLEHLANKKPNEMSGGQQQRIAIARALAQNPKLLLADEPTANLDTVSSKVVMETFIKANKEFGTTIILVTHEPDIASYAERKVHVRDGTIERIEG
ncbi:ABC transporter ATP-binding protein [Stygiolobus caldivivus]|uniref:Macrolide ABC transporter ATP-binding protein n=1 Tax=Stygiolobus caldivivus TaxID=2824673 RepID=A0A8D5U7T3_9CREN|nr:ABC transporter ATP-binding protein [Stygiolobus caldivivus]BCU70924.1 macrolide ABC transporter ATP-binding protein [Stygiolobus caldivivus]